MGSEETKKEKEEEKIEAAVSFLDPLGEFAPIRSTVEHSHKHGVQRNENVTFSTLSESEPKFEIKRETPESKKLQALFQLIRGKRKIISLVLLTLIIAFGAWTRTIHLKILEGNLLGVDPYLFLRYTQEIVDSGSLFIIDQLRYYPVGFNTLFETRLLPYFIAQFHNLLSLFNPGLTLVKSSIFYPVVAFSLTIVVFFFLIKKISNWKIALLSSAFLVVIPTFFFRTVAGFADKEPLGILLMTISFYFAVCMFKEESYKKELIYASLTGLFTGLLGLVWGVVDFSLMIISSTFFVLFFLGRSKPRNFFVYSLWMTLTFLILVLFSQKYDETFLKFFLGNQGVFIATFIFAVLLLHLLFGDKLSKIKFKLKSKFNLSSEVKSFVVALIIGIFASIFIFGTNFLGEMFQRIYGGLLHPLGTDTLTLTIQENTQPFLSLWLSDFNLWFLILIFFGSLLFYGHVHKKFDKRVQTNATIVFSIFLFTTLFSRYAEFSILNGDNFISKIIYFAGLFFFLVSTIIIYNNSQKEEGKLFDPTAIFVLVWFIWLFIGARGAVRLFFLFSPIASFMSAFFIVKGFEYGQKIKDQLFRIVIVACIIFLAIAAFFVSSNGNVYGAESFTSDFNLQWQDATDWISTSTPDDAVIASWWDYGYWIQAGGRRATILDGGNAIPYWNHLFARQVLTADNEQDALEWLYSHDATHLLIASEDAKKYYAYSTVASEDNLDRASKFGIFDLTSSGPLENSTGTQYLYTGKFTFNEDIIIDGFLLPKETALIDGFFFIVEETENGRIVNPPVALIDNQNQKIKIPLNCLYFENKFFEFDKGIDGCMYIMPSFSLGEIGDDLIASGGGTAMYLSGRVKNSLYGKLYFFDESTSFNLVYEEQHFIVEYLRGRYNLTLPNMIFFNDDFKGPIKIWEMNYPVNIEKNENFLVKEQEK